MKPTTHYPLANHHNKLSASPTKEVFYLTQKKLFQKLGNILEQNAEYYTNHFIMHRNSFHNSTICAKTGTFCSQNSRICSPMEQFHPTPINPHYRIVALSYYRINYLTQFTLVQISKTVRFSVISHGKMNKLTT